MCLRCLHSLGRWVLVADWNFDNAAEILSRNIPPQRWVIDGILPEGLTLLCGSPKAGKSWLSLDMALHVASGAPFWGHSTQPGKVLLLALEDGERRLKSRLEKLLEGREDLSPALLYPCFSVPPLEAGFAAGLDFQLKDFGGSERVSLVVIDTLGKVREPSRLDGYQRDYQQLAALKKVADKYHVAMLVIHHLRKMPSADVFDSISGTNGILGAADGAFVLKRNSRTDRNGKLFYTSRDADDSAFAVKFDDSCRWNLLSDDAESFDFMALPLVQFLQQIQLPWTGFPADLVAEYTGFCASKRIDTGLPLSGTAAAMGRKLAGISSELWRLRLSYNTKHTAKGNMLEFHNL